MKKEILRIGILCGLLGFTFSANAQEYIDKKITDSKGNIHLITFKSGKYLTGKSSLDMLSSLLSLSPDSEMRLQKSKQNGDFLDENYQMFYNNLKVEFGRYNLHYKNGNLTSMNGNIFSVDNSLVSPRISANDALSKALTYVNARKYMWEDTEYVASNSYRKPQGELVLLPVQSGKDEYNLQLVYKFDIYAAQPISRAIIYVDALEGRIVFSNAVLKHHGEENLIPVNSKKTEPIRIVATKSNEPTLLVTGTSDTRYSGSKSIETNLVSGSYILQDITRGNGVRTYNLKKSSSMGSAVDFKDTDNNWTAAEYDNANFDNAALDAHWGVAKTYDYFKETFNRNSYDDNGALLKSYVHYGNSYENAGWTGSEMIYGDGATRFKPLTGFDVTAHELGHAVCEYTADLAYERESGAMNEGFSDIWGAIVEHKYAPEKQAFLIGEDITKASPGYLRSMSNPKVALSAQPDTYRGTNWKAATLEEGCTTPLGGSSGNDYCGVHTNSGVLNHWFYILVMGKTGTNDIGKAYNVTGIGWDKAEKIVYRLESTYLTANSNYKNARDFGIQVAKELYGNNSPEMIAVQDAFYAVGIGVRYLSTPDTTPPTVPTNLTANNIKGTSVNLIWNASTDLEGVEGYIVYKGGVEIARTSGLTYKVSGLTKVTNYKFSVKAIDVYGNISNESNILNVTTTNQVEYCTSQSSNTADERIKRVVFGSIDNSSTGTAGYEDFTNISTEVIEGNTYAISITPSWSSTIFSEGYAVFIDWNGDGDFDDANEKPVTVASTTTNPVIRNITVPANASFDNPLVMRVSMKYDGVPTSCESFTFGQVEDYIVIAKKKVLSANDLSGKNQTAIFPNPVKNVLNIQSKESGDYNYKIINIAGQVVSNGKSADRKINVNQLSTGNYIIELTDRHGEKSVQKFIKK